MLAGVDRWTQYGALMVTDAGMRVAVAVGHLRDRLGARRLSVGDRRRSDGVADPADRLPVDARGGAAADPRRHARPSCAAPSHSIAAAGASAILVMGFPVLLKATSGDLGAAGGVVILAVTLTRAPLLVPLTAMQGNLIAHFVDQRTERLRALLAPAAVVAVLGAAGGAARRVVRAVAAAGGVRGASTGRAARCWPG